MPVLVLFSGADTHIAIGTDKTEPPFLAYFMSASAVLSEVIPAPGSQQRIAPLGALSSVLTVTAHFADGHIPFERTCNFQGSRATVRIYFTVKMWPVPNIQEAGNQREICNFPRLWTSVV